MRTAAPGRRRIPRTMTVNHADDRPERRESLAGRRAGGCCSPIRPTSRRRVPPNSWRSRAWPLFQALGSDLLGLSVDGAYLHLARLMSSERRFATRIPLPILDDPAMTMASASDLIHSGESDTSALGATFVIDPDSRCAPCPGIR